MHFAIAITFAVFTTTINVTMYTPSPEACRLARTNCLNPNDPTMGTGIRPFVGAAACSYDFPLGTIIRVQDAPTTLSVNGASFTVPTEVVCLDRFGRPTRNRRVDLVLLVPENPGLTELQLARQWGYRQLAVTVERPQVFWRPYTPLPDEITSRFPAAIPR